MSPPIAAGLRLGLLAGTAVALLAAIHALTRERIAESQRRLERQALAEVLPPGRHDHDPLADVIEICDEAQLGPGRHRLYRLRRLGQPSALVVHAVAPDGYSGPIALMVGVDVAGKVLGVRVTEHRETPGLGDAIEAAKNPWIRQFEGRSLGDPPAERWRVGRRGGDFDALLGATVSSQAVTEAVRRVLELIEREGTSLFSEDGPETLRCP
ncbi:MAG: electron transport complex subunit G [Lysobacterales bacterium]|jgi:electron transport complex protein RnfG|nr:MAG: electron transport complex subunit G [Xanthomonadales bacterium]